MLNGSEIKKIQTDKKLKIRDYCNCKDKQSCLSRNKTITDPSILGANKPPFKKDNRHGGVSKTRTNIITVKR